MFLQIRRLILRQLAVDLILDEFQVQAAIHFVHAKLTTSNLRRVQEYFRHLSLKRQFLRQVHR